MAEAPLEDLIRRYEAGDRDPELLRQLNAAAWNGFHDPWEAPAPAARNPVTGERVPAPAFEPEALAPFTFETIQRFLEPMKYRYWRQGKGYFMVTFAYTERTDRCLQASFMVQGKHLDIFKLQITCDRRVQAERFDRAFRLCNDWNQRFRWPRASLELAALERKEGQLLGPEPPSALLALDFQLFLRAGIPQALFDSLVKDAIATSWEFWELAHDEYGM